MVTVPIFARRLARHPARTLAVVGTLGVGIAGAVAMFSLVDGLLLQPLRFRQPTELVAVWERGVADGAAPSATQAPVPSTVGYATFADWRDRSRSFAALAAMSVWQPTALGEGELAAEKLPGLRVSAGFFDLLGVAPALGRGFLPEEDAEGKHRVAVITDGLWRRRFAADPRAVGGPIHFDGADYVLVGVLPPSFESLFSPAGYPAAEIFRPLAYDVAQPWACRTCRHLRVVGRLAPSVSRAAAESELDAVGRALAAEHPQAYPAGGAIVRDLADQLFGEQRPLLFGLLAAVTLVLTIATANVASLQIAAGLPRSAEMAIRGALGARPRDVLGVLVLEGALTGVAGAVAGGVLSLALVRLAVAWAPPGLPRLHEVGVDGRGLALATILGLLSAVVSNLAPLRSLTRSAGAARVLGGARSLGDRGRHRALALLLSFDLALSIVLVAGAGLLGTSLLRLLSQEPGFQPGRLVGLELSIGGPRAEDPASVGALYDEVVAAVRAVPGVADAAVTTQVPLFGDHDRFGVHPEGFAQPNPELDPSADRYSVTSSFVRTLGVPLLAGRDLVAADRADSEPVVLVSAALERRAWPDARALGRRIRVGGSDGPWRRVVGVVGDVRHEGLESSSDGAVYLPTSQWLWADTSSILVVRTTGGDLASWVGAARAALRSVDRNLVVGRIATMEQSIATVTSKRRFAARLVGGFAAVALLLAVLGVYGVVSHTLGERRREIGLRRALGATRGDILWLVVRGILALAAGGLAAGLVGAAGFGRALSSQLYAVSATDPWALGGSAALLLVVSMIAALWPAVVASRVEPADVIRGEG
jgi:putative ABC transport system permease protein